MITAERMGYGRIKLLPGLFKTRSQLKSRYVMSLDSTDLLQIFYLHSNNRNFTIELVKT